MKKISLLFILIMFGLLTFNPAYSWGRKSKNSQPQSAAQTRNKSQSPQTQSETTYPDDVEEDDGADIDVDIEEQYRKMPVPEHKYIHDIDPDEYQDTMYSTWSPYPLFRLTSPLYFKTIAIEPGYYLLTPREHEGKYYILFKQAGKIKYIVPTYKKEMVPYNFYKDNLPQIKMTKVQIIREKTLNWVGKHFDSAKRQPTPDTYLEASDLDNNFISIVLYWGNYRYYFVLRSIRL